MSSDRVGDDELLFRGVPSVHIGEDGCLKASAFNDRYQRPSVDRGVMFDNDPTRAPLLERISADAVYVLIAQEIRTSPRISEKDSNNRTVADGGSYKADVEPVVPDNYPEHAEIFLTRDPLNDGSTNPGAFKKLKVRLSEIAKPAKPLSSNQPAAVSTN